MPIHPYLALRPAAEAEPQSPSHNKPCVRCPITFGARALEAMLRRSLLRSTQALRLQPSAASCLRKSSSQVKLASQEFNESRERSLLRHVISSSTEGDPNSVTAAMDTFWDTYFNGEGTAEWNLRGEALDEAVKAKGPKTAMEIGTYCGYTAVRMGKFIPDGGKLISVEIDPLYAAIATKASFPDPP